MEEYYPEYLAIANVYFFTKQRDLGKECDCLSLRPFVAELVVKNCSSISNGTHLV